MSKKQVKSTISKNKEVAGVGHNKPGGIEAEKLKSLVQRFEKLEEEKSAIQDDIRDVIQEVKSQGFDVKIFRAMVKLRQVDSDERDAYFYTLDTYARALGFSILDLED